MEPINLQSEFGGRWQIAVDESAGSHGNDPWCQVVVCRHGLIYPVGPSLLGAATDRPGEVVHQLRQIDGVEVVQDGDDGANVVFHRAQLRYVERVMRPRRVRKRLPSKLATEPAESVVRPRQS